MVSSCAVYFDDIFIDSQKGSIPVDFIYLFQESDRLELKPEWIDNADHVSTRVFYRASRAVILDRLDLGGFTAEYAEKEFQVWLEEEQESYNSYVIEGNEWAKANAEALAALNYLEWKSRLKDVLVTRYDQNRDRDFYIDGIDRLMRDDNTLAFSYPLVCIRAMLDALPDVQEISLEIGPLIDGGWIEPDARICEEARGPAGQERTILAPAVIIAEGGTDILVLQKSLKRLYPHLSEYITFFNYEGPNSDGGVTFMVKFLRAFAAARINTLIIAVFDNDAAGLEALQKAKNLALPENIRITALPDIELARSYPTIGPQGMHEVDINGRAVSIELFLGRHNISGQDGSLTPVVWSNYVPAVQRYQGAIRDKGVVLQRFLKDIETEGEAADYRARYPELVTLWNRLFLLIR